MTKTSNVQYSTGNNSISQFGGFGDEDGKIMGVPAIFVIVGVVVLILLLIYFFRCKIPLVKTLFKSCSDEGGEDNAYRHYRNS